MKNIKKKLLLSTLAVGAIASVPALSPVEHVEAASKVAENLFDAGAGTYRTISGNEVPLVMKMLPSHMDYPYYKQNGLTQRDGNIYLYLQQYKGEMFYYSPAIRYFDASGKNHGKRPDGSTDEFAREVIAKLQGTKFYPTKIIREHQLRAHVPRVRSFPREAEGYGRSSKFSIMTKQAIALNMNYGGRGVQGNHNFRIRTMKNQLSYVWAPKNTFTANTQNPHPDVIYKHGGINAHGEFRTLGYQSSGQRFQNPYFPADGMRSNNEEGFRNYPLLALPWSYTGANGTPNNRFTNLAIHSGIDEYVYQYAMHVGKLPKNYQYQSNSQEYWREAEQKYKEKRRAMTQLYERYNEVRLNMSAHGYSNKSAAIEALTIRYASMQSTPLESGQSVTVHFARQASRTASGTTWYEIYFTMPNSGVENKVHDTRITRQRVYRGNQLLQTFTREGNGRTYVEPKTAPEVEPGQTLRVVTDVSIFNGFRDAFQSNLYMKTNASSQEYSYTRNGGGLIRHNQPNVFERNIVVPEKEGAFDINTWLDRNALLSTWDVFANSHRHTARNSLQVIQDRGDFKSEFVEIVGRDGKVVNQPVPGQEYKLRYAYKYVSVNGKNARRNTALRLDFNIGREMVGSPLHGRDDSGREGLTRTVRPTHNKLYYFETGFRMYETGQLDTQANLTVSEKRYDENGGNNTIKKDWKSVYDINVSNVKVLPTNTVNTQSQKATMLVQFDSEYITPSEISNIGQDVDFLVSIDGKTVEVKEHLRKGLNRNISVPVEIDLDGSEDKVLEAVVFANHNRNVYETDVNTQENNIGRGESKIENPRIESFKDSNNTSKWTQHIHKNSWKGQKAIYNTFSGARRNFTRFLTGDDQKTSTRALSEQYKIDAVRFRSRLTRSEEMGKNKDGWINLLEEDGVIRAGYGYELEVDVSYNTDALNGDFTNQTGDNGTWTRPRLSQPLLQDNIYIEMPDGQIRSAQGDGGTEQSLRLKEKTGNTRDMKWTFEIDGGESLGTETVGRFYIGEDVKDGRYPLNVFTPKVRGVNGKMTSATEVLEHLLYDSASDLGINVVGSSVDDISDHINR